MTSTMTPMQRHRLLALTPFERLAQGWQSLGIQARHRCVRGPETGMAMVRGRMGGSGSAFNLGEMTLTRASVALDDGSLGHGWVRGRDKAHAELIALVDALCATRPLGPAHRQRTDGAAGARTITATRTGVAPVCGHARRLLHHG